jgi:hypothetical protein
MRRNMAIDLPREELHSQHLSAATNDLSARSHQLSAANALTTENKPGTLVTSALFWMMVCDGWLQRNSAPFPSLNS